MIDGIRIAPHVYALRRESRVSGSGAQAKYLDCGECMANLDEASRADMHCGFLPRSPGASGQYAIPVDAPRPSCDTCPGYLIGLPEVGEALRAHLWWEKGQLALLIGDEPASPLLTLYVEAVAGAVADVQLAAERDRHQEAERSRRR